MNKILRINRFLTILIFCFAVCFLSTKISFADSIPYSEKYVYKDLRIDGVLQETKATFYTGNIYIDADILKEYGNVESWDINYTTYKIYIPAESLNVTIADSETTSFIKKNGGTFAINLKSLSTSFNSNWRPYFSLEMVAPLCGLEWSYNNDTIYITSHKGESNNYVYEAKDKSLFDKPINGMWSDLYSVPEKIDGVDVLADIAFIPTLSGKTYDGAHSISNYGFIKEAKSRGYVYWLCAQNFNTANSDTYDYIDFALKDRETANYIIAQYLFHTAILNADGINIDYEEMSASDRNYFIYFMQTLSRFTNKMGITLSVCTYGGTAYNNQTVYPYDILGQCCDYVIEMTYQPFRGENSIAVMDEPLYTQMTDYISTLMPNEKLIMGVADYTFYTYWKDGVYCGYETVSMNGIWADKEDMTMTWDETAGMYYCEQPYIKAGVEYVAKFYVEEERSAARKAQYILDRGYGGTFGWALGYTDTSIEENANMLAAYKKVYQDGFSYEDFVPAPPDDPVLPPEDPVEPEDPDEPNEPDEPDEPDNPDESENQEETTEPEETEEP